MNVHCKVFLVLVVLVMMAVIRAVRCWQLLLDRHLCSAQWPRAIRDLCDQLWRDMVAVHTPALVCLTTDARVSAQCRRCNLRRCAA